MRKNLFVAAVATGLLALGAAAPASASPAAGPVLAPCSGAADLPRRARCGSLRVALDRANPGLATTRVAFALVPRRDGSRPSLGTVVANPGGPGVAAIGGSESPYARSLAPILDRRDLLLVDPRGTGRSDALACRALEGVDVVFGSRERFVAAIGACGRQLGSRVGLYGTAAVADDIETVRAALGLERLDLWGDSYGGYLMPVYAARHPEHVRSIVLNGAHPIDFDPWGRPSLGAARRAIRLVCARTRACRGEAVLRDVARLAARLRARPVSFAVAAGARRFRARLDEGALASVVFASGNAAAYGRIPAAVASGLAGDLAPLRRLVEHDLLGLARIVRDPSFSFAQNLATICHDYPRVFSYADAPAARLAAYERALKAIDAGAFWPFSPAGWTLTGQAGATCLEWPDDRTATSPLPRGTPLPDVPVLVLSGDLDANASSQGGRRAAAQFARATFVEIPNAGHTATAYSACAAAVGLRFVATHRVSPRACAGTGAPPAVARSAPRRAAELPLVRTDTSRAVGRALSLVLATAGDLEQQGPILEAWGSAAGLRGGRYVAARDRTIRLFAVRVVRDASVSGSFALRAGDRLEGMLRLTGPGIPDGQLQVRLTASGRGRAIGVLGGRSIDLAFRP
jgi:pimeloyl-ACP methyl ester carboxylesterase